MSEGEINQIIHQVKSETRNENFRKFFTKNSKILITCCCVVVVCAIGFFIFNSYQESQEKKFSAMLQQSVIFEQDHELDKAKQSLQDIINAGSAPSNIKALAGLRYAGLLLNEANSTEAITAYQAVNQCQACDPYFKDLAGLLMVKIWMSDSNELQKPDLLQRIEKIEQSNQFLRNEITEQKAILAMQKDDLATAYQIFESLSKNPEMDKEVKGRASEALKIVIAKGYKPTS